MGNCWYCLLCHCVKPCRKPVKHRNKSPYSICLLSYRYLFLWQFCISVLWLRAYVKNQTVDCELIYICLLSWIVLKVEGSQIILVRQAVSWSIYTTQVRLRLYCFLLFSFHPRNYYKLSLSVTFSYIFDNLWKTEEHMYTAMCIDSI